MIIIMCHFYHIFVDDQIHLLIDQIEILQNTTIKGTSFLLILSHIITLASYGQLSMCINSNLAKRSIQTKVTMTKL